MTLPFDPRTPTGAAIVGQGAQALKTAQGTITDITGALTATRRWVSDRHNWVRVAWTVSGLVMIYVGVVVLARRPIAAGLRSSGVPTSLGEAKSQIVGVAKLSKGGSK